MPIVVENVAAITGESISWIEFAKINFIPCVLYGIFNIFVLQFFLPAHINKADLKKVIDEQYNNLGSMCREERLLLIIMAIILLLLVFSGKLHIKTSTILMCSIFVFFLPLVKIMDTKKLNTINFTPLFFVMSYLAIGSAATQIEATAWISDNLLGMLKEMSVLGANIAGFIMAYFINFVLTPVSALSTFTSAITNIAIEMGMNPYILVGSFNLGFSNILLPYESAVLLLFYSFGYISFKKMVMALFIRLIVSGIVLAVLALPYMKWITS